MTSCRECGEEIVGGAKFCHVCGSPIDMAAEPTAPDFITLRARDPQLVYAPVWRRALASAIDVSLLITVVLPGVIAFFWVVELATSFLGMDPEDGRFLAGIAAVLLFATADWLYHAIMESRPRQATLGKQFMGLKVTAADGDPLEFGQASGRHFGKYLSTFGLFVGFLMACFTRRKQALHDIIASTLVLRR